MKTASFKRAFIVGIMEFAYSRKKSQDVESNTDEGEESSYIEGQEMISKRSTLKNR